VVGSQRLILAVAEISAWSNARASAIELLEPVGPWCAMFIASRITSVQTPEERQGFGQQKSVALTGLIAFCPAFL